MGGPRYFVHRWTATQLAHLAARSGDPRLAQAHRNAAAYWRWRVRVWPQDRSADLRDLLKARHHLLHAGDTEEATELSEAICTELHTQGAWDEEYALIHDTLTRLLPDSPRHAAWIHQLGILAQDRGDYQEADRQYRRSLDILRRLGDQAGMATSYHQLGILAQLRGDYAEAERQYRRALEIFERLGNQAGMASGYHQLGRLAQFRGDYQEAERQYRRSLDIKERLGNQAGMATSYHQLGILAQLRGDYAEAERQYRRSLDIEERLGNQAGMATSYSQLGILEAERGQHEQSIEWHVQALAIRLRLGVPEAVNNLRRLEAHRTALGPGGFAELLVQAAGAEDAQTITSLMDQLVAADARRDQRPASEA
jgi:tetratricopeptide (TPR) repeat protein